MTHESGKQPVIHKKHIARLERERRQTRLILYAFFGILAAVVLLLIYGWVDVNYLQVNRAVATVDGEKISLKNFEARTRLYRQNLINDYEQYAQYEQYFGMDMSAQLDSIQTQLNNAELVGQSVLDSLIDEKIIELEAKKRGIVVSDAEIDERMEASFNFFPNGSPTPSLTPTAFIVPTEPPEILDFVTATPEFTATVEPQPTADSDATATPVPTNTLAPTITPTATVGPTATALPTATPFTREAYEDILGKTNENLAKYGFDKTYVREYFRAQILREKLTGIIAADVKPIEEQIRARHILVADEETAKNIISLLQAGGDFADLAREYSKDSSASNGGDIGWFGKGQMVAEFEAAAFALKNPGDYTETPVASQFGYHIIQLIGRQERPLSESSYQTARNIAVQNWLTKAREEEYKVKTFDFWKQRVPTTPNFASAATEMAVAQLTAQADTIATMQALGTVTAAPAP